jgi:1-acyl-sn-glycerol-3-phosphate acyltransferase
LRRVPHRNRKELNEDDVLMPKESVPVVYRVVMAIAAPIVRWWGRLEVVGAQILPTSGGAVLIANHDRAWDPLVLGVAAMPRRQLRALAKSSLWRVRPVAWLLDQMGQIPIDRGRFDTQALSVAIDALQAGACVGIFPEGTVSRGQPLRPLSGAGRLALSAPDARVVCVSVSGAVDVVRFPKRPRIRVEFFEPAGGPPRPGETAVGLTKRTMAEVRARAPSAVPGRRRKAAEFQRLAAEAELARERP